MGPPAFAHRRGPGAELVRGLVLLDDRRGNTAALAHLVSAAHALISALRSRPGPVRALRRRPVALTLRAWLVYSRVQFLACGSPFPSVARAGSGVFETPPQL